MEILHLTLSNISRWKIGGDASVINVNLSAMFENSAFNNNISTSFIFQ